MTTKTVKQLTQELEALKAILSTQANSPLMVKINASGGIYIRHSSFKEFSTAKNKEYVAGVNMGFITAKTLFNSPQLVEQIRDAINALK